MNDNEKRILTVLNQGGPATRKEIAAACGISWAATVKLVSRLEEKGFLRCLGESEAKTENGKTSLVCALSSDRPLAAGIDVEYSRTRAAVYSLRREVLYSESVPTEGSGGAGEMGHLTVDPAGPPCRCGKRGCVETFFNQSRLAAAWAEISARAAPAPESAAPAPEISAPSPDGSAPASVPAPDAGSPLAAFFSRAAASDGPARELLSRFSGYLLPAVSALSLSLDIRRVILAGHFGPDGAVLSRSIEAGLKRELHPRFRHSIGYEALDDDGFLIGAAMLFLNGFCDFRVLETGRSAAKDLQ